MEGKEENKIYFVSYRWLKPFLAACPSGLLSRKKLLIPESGKATDGLGNDALETPDAFCLSSKTRNCVGPTSVALKFLVGLAMMKNQFFIIYAGFWTRKSNYWSFLLYLSFVNDFLSQLVVKLRFQSFSINDRRSSLRYLMTFAESCWLLLKVAEICWLLLKVADFCWKLLKVADFPLLL